MRVGELTGLRWVDVDLDGGMIKINHTLVYYKKADGKCSYTINTTKTEAGDREIPMTEEVKSAFLAVKEFYDDIGMKCNASVDGYAKNGTMKRTRLSQRRFQETHIIARGGCVNTDTVGTQKYVSERTRVKLARFANPNLIACSFSFWFRYMQNSII